MKVFLDTNVIIDFYANREEFFKPASIIIDLAYHGKITLYASALSFVNAYYVLGRTYKVETLNEKLNALANVCNITPIDEHIIRESLVQHRFDFEDRVQYESACTMSPDVIVTRDIKHFMELPIDVKEPISFLNDFLG